MDMSICKCNERLGHDLNFSPMCRCPCHWKPEENPDAKSLRISELEARVKVLELALEDAGYQIAQAKYHSASITIEEALAPSKGCRHDIPLDQRCGACNRL